MASTPAPRTGLRFGSGLLRSGLGIVGVLLAGGLTLAQDEPKLAGVEVPAPKRAKFVSPEYPAEAKALGQRGIVILSLVIGTDGKVVSVEVVRSVPAFDEAAVAAARLWEYEITKVDGRPVPVRISVPITFALRLPEVIRGPGVPELREGLAPNRPAGVPDKDSATVIAALTVEPSGQVVAIEVEKGEWPWFEPVAAALRTWAFVAGGSEAVASYQVQALFLPVRKNEARVELRIERKTGAAPPTEAAQAPAGARTPASEPPAAAPAPTSAPDAPTETERPGVPSTPPPAAIPAPTPEPPAAAAVPPVPVAPAPPIAAPAAPPLTLASPAAGTPQPAASASPEGTPRPAAPVSSASGFSALRDVKLGPGVPDLTAGRRPVVPPLARLGEVSGMVEVRFAVDAGGVTSGIEAAGPELLRQAARQTVASWSFRRTSTDRLFLVALFEYGSLQASATVRRVPD